jgi:hypothetical protein
MNSREKGKRGERQWRDELRSNGYAARRGQQFSGSPDSPDVVCDALAWAHFEVKAVEKLNIEDAMEQARRDGGASRTGHPKVPIVAHKRNFRPWLITMDAETFFKFLRGELPPEEPRMDTNKHGCTSPQPSPQSGEGEEKIWASQQQRPTSETENKTKKENENENQS